VRVRRERVHDVVGGNVNGLRALHLCEDVRLNCAEGGGSKMAGDQCHAFGPPCWRLLVLPHGLFVVPRLEGHLGMDSPDTPFEA